MAQTVSNFADVMKDIWTPDRLEKQFYDEHPLLRRFERTNRYTLGKQAQVPIHKGRAGAHTVTSPAGSASVNAADAQKVDQAVYTLTQQFHQIELEVGVLNQGDGGNHSVAEALELEVSGGVNDMSHQVTRQLVSNGDALIAQCDSSTTTTTINLLPTGYGYDAIVRGWLVPGQPIDIGTTASENAIADGVTIVSVKEDESDPEIVISGSNVTTTSSHYVSLKDARNGTTPYETHGLRQIVGGTGALGGLNPASAGEEFWRPAYVDSSTSVLSLDLLLTLRRKIHQKTGKKKPLVATSLKQASNLYSLLQNQVRFSFDKGLDAGGDDTVKWNGMEIMTVPDIPDRELYMLSVEDFFILTGKYSKPTWVSDIEGGSGGRLRWKQGSTAFVDMLFYGLNLGVKRRNSHAAAIALTA